MGKLSQREAGVIARQITVCWNREQRAAYDSEVKAAEKKAFTDKRWQTVLTALGRHGMLKFNDSDWRLTQVFEKFREQNFPVKEPVYMSEKDALRIVEFCGVQGHHLPEIEKIVLQVWQNEQR